MSASIFSFRRRAEGRQAPVSDWSTQELAELYRVCERLREAGLQVSVQRGLSDEGEPWAVFERDDTADVIVHIARIDNVVIIVNVASGSVYRGADFRAITNQLLSDAPLVMPRQDGKSSNVVMHPRAVLTAFVAAALIITEFARSIETAHAADDTGDVDVPPAATEGLFGQLISRLLMRETTVSGSGLFGNSSVLGFLGAAALAIDLSINDPKLGDTVSQASIADALGNIIPSGSPSPSESHTEATIQRSDAVGEGSAMQAMLIGPDIGMPGIARKGTSVNDVAIDTGAAQARAEVEIERALAERLKLHENAQSETPPEASHAAPNAPTNNAAAAATAEAAKEKETTGSAKSDKISVTLTQADREKVMDAILIVDLGNVKDGLGSLLRNASVDQGTKVTLGDKGQAAKVDAVEHIRYSTLDAGESISLSNGKTDIIVYEGGESHFTNFRFGEDKIVISGAESRSEWIKDLFVYGNDVHIVGVDGGQIWLYDSFASIA
jgi:hypothetical protein